MGPIWLFSELAGKRSFQIQHAESGCTHGSHFLMNSRWSGAQLSSPGRSPRERTSDFSRQPQPAADLHVPSPHRCWAPRAGSTLVRVGTEGREQGGPCQGAQDSEGAAGWCARSAGRSGSPGPARWSPDASPRPGVSSLHLRTASASQPLSRQSRKWAAG